MRAVRVALITRPGSVPGQRNAGWWAYPVPEFTWDHYPTSKGTTLSRARLSGHDLILHEDGKTLIEWIDDGPPVAYLVGDSTLSDDHYRRRLQQASQANLILVDWDRLERFAHLGIPVRRLSYCVDDRRFRDWGEPKSVDIAFHMSEDDPHRRILGDDLAAICQANNWTMTRGVLLEDAYARAFNRTRIVVNVNRTAETRNHRVFDAMACRACLLTEPLPAVSAEERTAGLDYVEMREGEDLRLQLRSLLAGNWQPVAESGYALVQHHHTWAVRARQLRAILAEVFGWKS